MHNGDWYGMGYGSWWWIFMPVLMIAFWGGIIWFAIAVFQRAGSTRNRVGNESVALSPPNDDHRKSTREILEIRLAKGEIEVDDYHQRLKALTTNE